ncbi:transcription activator effector binding protein [Paenibacillus mucilaginosus 3016]|uniref:Transcription activator effector binding protein n=2 Tax=Paenibacillus mucilaginosus TaxID=61624 RepID=H6ND00_9BACL|nr:GyrI-like domain-containing protein [Paenibacillus mucilaginosus]AFC29482.1 transcription activator effector binding protein [Paenibacillus mucilaginosus 3016]AFH61660.1 transcriptional regulator [Paenibacillus mucilaginosus K02]WFA18189.1 AraC family transcriptional regulator [Paenibacillus mucilaginosus]
MTRVLEAQVIQKPAFRAVGLRWEGTFAEAAAGGIRLVQQELRGRLGEIAGQVNPEQLLGLSYHAHPEAEGFVHYAVLETVPGAGIPEGMLEISVPTLAYAECGHAKGQDIQETYRLIYEWISEQGYVLNKDTELTHYEVYPVSQNPYDPDPEFTIRIPIKGQ